MAHVICQPCVGVKDTACILECPTDAIHPLPTEGNFVQVSQLFIDPNACSDCGNCVIVCPVSAIYPAAIVPYQWQDYIQINADYYGLYGTT